MIDRIGNFTVLKYMSVPKQVEGTTGIEIAQTKLAWNERLLETSAMKFQGSPYRQPAIFDFMTMQDMEDLRVLLERHLKRKKEETVIIPGQFQ